MFGLEYEFGRVAELFGLEYEFGRVDGRVAELFGLEYEFGRVAVDELGRVSERGRVYVLDDVFGLVYLFVDGLLDVVVLRIVLFPLSTGLLNSLDVFTRVLPFDL